MSSSNSDKPGGDAPKPSLTKQLVKAHSTIKDAADVLKYEDLTPFVDTEKVRFENLDKLNQIELFALLEKQKLPSQPLIAMGLLTLGYFGGLTYLAFKRGGRYMLKYTEGKPKTIGTMVLYGTLITSKAFLGYGLLMAPLVWHFKIVERMNQINQIRNRLGDSIIINNEELQDTLLVSTLQYFNLSDKLIESAKEELEARRVEMAKKDESLEAVVAKLKEQGYIEADAAQMILDKKNNRLRPIRDEDL